MRLTSYHDSNGKIVGLALASSQDAVRAEVVANHQQPELHGVDVEVPSGTQLDPSDPRRLHEELARLAKEYRVENGALKKIS